MSTTSLHQSGFVCCFYCYYVCSETGSHYVAQNNIKFEILLPHNSQILGSWCMPPIKPRLSLHNHKYLQHYQTLNSMAVGKGEVSTIQC